MATSTYAKSTAAEAFFPWTTIALSEMASQSDMTFWQMPAMGGRSNKVIIRRLQTSRVPMIDLFERNVSAPRTMREPPLKAPSRACIKFLTNL